jgi:hypothetical protein
LFIESIKNKKNVENRNITDHTTVATQVACGQRTQQSAPATKGNENQTNK